MSGGGNRPDGTFLVRTQLFAFLHISPAHQGTSASDVPGLHVSSIWPDYSTCTVASPGSSCAAHLIFR